MSRPWMPFYVGDYLRDTGNLGALEHGAYLLLILHYWQHGGLPEDEEELSSIARLTMPEWEKARRRLSRLFYDGWKHKRIEKELKKANDKYEKRAAAGKRGGIAKAVAKQNDSKPLSNASGNALANGYQPQTEREEDSSSTSEPLVPGAKDEGIPKVRRDQVSPNDPVLQRPDDPLAIYSDVELKGFAFEFDGLDIDSGICELAHWARKKGITDPIELKSAIYGGLKSRHAKAKLHDAMQSPTTATASPQLAASRLARQPVARRTAQR